MADGDTPDLMALVAAFQSQRERLQGRVRSLVRHYGQMLLTNVKANASGRPGPNVITGDYRRSIDLELETFGTSASAIVGTAAPQARRLEYGFAGVDAKGRHYDQAPFPHFGPALDKVGPEFTASLLDAAVTGL